MLTLRETRLDVRQQLLVPLERQFRVQAALHQNLVAAEGHGLFNFSIQNFARQDVHLFVPRGPVEGAEIADSRTLVGVIDVAVDVVRAKRFGMQPPRDGIGRAAQLDQVVRFDEPQSLFGRQPLAINGFLKQWRNRGRQGPLLPGPYSEPSRQFGKQLQTAAFGPADRK